MVNSRDQHPTGRGACLAMEQVAGHEDLAGIARSIVRAHFKQLAVISMCNAEPQGSWPSPPCGVKRRATAMPSAGLRPRSSTDAGARRRAGLPGDTFRARDPTRPVCSTIEGGFEWPQCEV
jgi:hypothetical protein